MCSGDIQYPFILPSSTLARSHETLSFLSTKPVPPYRSHAMLRKVGNKTQRKKGWLWYTGPIILIFPVVTKSRGNFFFRSWHDGGSFHDVYGKWKPTFFSFSWSSHKYGDIRSFSASSLQRGENFCFFYGKVRQRNTFSRWLTKQISNRWK